MWFSKLLQRSNNKYIKLYLKECGRIRRTYPAQYDRNYLFRIFPRWYQSQTSDKSPLDDRRPWLTERAIQFIDDIINPEMNILEYGCGGSTLFFLDKGCHVTSVEHNKNWIEAVSLMLDDKQKHQWQSHLVHKKNTPIDEFENTYCHAPLAPEAAYNMVLIDGLAREKCLAALKKTTFSGWLIYDNSDRFTDKQKLQQISQNTFKQFVGPTLYSMPFTETTILDM